MKTQRSHTRWTLNERIQHWVLAISFILLVITGFQLKYPEAWWTKPFVGAEWLFDLRGLLHRISAAVMLAIGVYHIFYMLATKRGRLLTNELLPRKQDLSDFVQNVGYNFGLKSQPPQFGHFSYIEKTEYFALIWGTVIMGVTGLMLWFEQWTLALFSRWVIDLLTVIHLYEAWLATLAIVIWHFYYVIFNPDIYPVNMGMFDGKISDKELRHEHELEWQAMQQKNSKQRDEKVKQE